MPSAQAIEDSLRRSVEILQTEGQAWMDGRVPIQDGQACVSCHQVPFGLWGIREAERAGVVLDAERSAELTRQAMEFISRPRKARAMSWGPLVLAGADTSPATDFLDFAIGAQRPRGHWQAKGQFPEQRRALEETNTVATLWTMLAVLRTGAPPTGETATSFERAYDSIESFGDGASTEWLLARGLVELGVGNQSAAAELTDRLLAQQNEDGGWSWSPGETSNAYSTGQALYALELQPSAADGARQRAARDEAIGRALTYLLGSQAPDGRWEVASSLTSREAGDSKDYVYTFWGTAWATIGLARTLAAWNPEELERLRERMTISLLGAPMETVASYFAARLGADLDLDPELESASITIELDDQPLSLGLDALCDQSSCAWRVETAWGKPRLQIVRRGPL